MATNSPGFAVDDDGENDEDNSEDDNEGEGGVEEDEAAGAERAIGRRGRRTGRGVTLSMLLGDGILKPGDGTMSIDYLGKNFVGDLLSSGKIRWKETRQLFNSPSAWAIYCKKQVNPEKKSGCGWASVKYQGRKLDYYKSLWFRKHRTVYGEDEPSNSALNGSDAQNGADSAAGGEAGYDSKPAIDLQNCRGVDLKRRLVSHSVLGLRNPEHDPNILVECTAFSTLGKIQPFTVTVASSCLVLMDFHCHLTTSEVVGYLAGNWDVNSHNLAVTHAFPCKCRLGDKDNAYMVEEQIRLSIDRHGLTLLGWYHSHPTCPAQPTLRDIGCQMDYQIRLKGSSDASYTPCLALICSPYDKESSRNDSIVQAFWAMPPPENRPLEYGKPMLMNYAIVPEPFLSHDVLSEMRFLYDYYKSAPDMINFGKEWADSVTYLEKLLLSLRKKHPTDSGESHLHDLLRGLLLDMQ